jgi:hypothetical protein
MLEQLRPLRKSRPPASRITIATALTDPYLLGSALGDPASWQTWITILKAAFGLPLKDDERDIFSTVAGNRNPPSQRVRELWAIVGRRGGKSRMAAALAVTLACFVRHKLARGEQGQVLVLAASQDQARVVFSYAKAFLTESPVLRQEIDVITRTEIRLCNGITIAIHSTSFRTIRGRTLCAAVFDEVAIRRTEWSAWPDTETYTAVLPSLLTTNGMLIGISTGYRRLGLLYQKHRDHFGIDSNDTLVVQGSTLQFNGTLDEAAIAAQRAADPAAAASEWDGSFRDDISTFLDDQLIDAAVEHGRPLELPPARGTFYRAFTDASGGTGNDAYSLAIGHKGKDGVFVIDVVRGTQGKFDPQEITKQYAELLKEYRVRAVTGDNYAAQWVAAAWRGTGVHYVKSPLPKSGIYLEVVPLFSRGLVRLPDHPKLLRELRLLERHTARSGKDTVDHPRGGHDDHANAVCGCLRSLANYLGFDTSYRWFNGDDQSDPDGTKAWQQLRTWTYLNSGGRTVLW